MRFTAGDTAPVADSGGLLGLNLEKADLLHLAQTALFGVIGVLTLLVVLRPMVLRITAVAPATLGGTAMASLVGPAASPSLQAPTTQAVTQSVLPPLLEDESLVNIAQIEGQMRASSLRRIGGLVEKHPEETLSIIRGWMVQESN
jgi:flagellar M-ring protein FliF